ncbi:MAG: hypothetical protein H6714_04990 [Myxococcales bacterium]|nr:hypothetical protein [Myxococcales bacterium]
MGTLLACAHDGNGANKRVATSHKHHRQPSQTYGVRAVHDDFVQAGTCPTDAALSRVAEGFSQSISPDAALLVALARKAHIAETRLHAWTGGQSETHAVSVWLSGIETRSDAPLVCGMARQGDSVTWVAAERAALLEVDRSSGILRAELANEFHRPVLVALYEDFVLHRQETSKEALRRGVSWFLDDRAPLSIQLVATGPSGSYPIAQIWNTEPRSIVALRGDEGAPIPARLTQLRRLFGADPMRHNRLLSRQAESHARDVCRTGKVSHELSTGADPRSRLAKMRIAADALGEAIARGRNTASAFGVLLESPSHLLALTDKRFTDVGMAQALDGRGASCLVIFMAAWPRIR